MSRTKDKQEIIHGVGIAGKLSLVSLWLMCLCSAVAVVFISFQSRQYTELLEELRREEIGLKVSSGQYQLERSSLASYPRIESIAAEKLKMNSPKSNETVLVVRE